MRVHLHPQRRTVEVAGRRQVGRLLAELGVLPNTAMVIRRDELLTDGEMVEDADEIEIRAVISGGADDATTTTRTGGAKGGFAGANPLQT
jgi:sulfur carrier protein